MDSTYLRLILLVLGVLLLVGIYFWDKKKRQQGPTQAKSKTQTCELPEIGSTPDLEDNQSTRWDLNATEPDNLESELAQLAEQMTDKGLNSAELQTGAAAETGLDQQEELFSFSAKQESPADVPSKIVQIILIAKQGSFSGPDIQAAMQEIGLQAGEMQIYHRYTSDGSQRVTFNMASLVEPGVFPLKSMADFTTPGLTLFTQLPGPGDSLAIFSDMLFTAQRLATILDGELQDETHSALTKQTVEHIRSQIMEHRRLVQLARSRR